MGELSRRSALGLGVASGLSAIGATAPAEAVAGALGVAIAVPILPKGDRLIVLGPGHRLHVVLTNRSDRPIRLWSWCSASESNLSFEVVEGEAIRVIRRQGQEWAKNSCQPFELAPGGHLVEEADFLPKSWAWPWPDSDPLPRRLRMRAVYRCEPSEGTRKEGIWTGRAESEFRDYRLEGSRR